MRTYLNILLMTALCLNSAVAVMARDDPGGNFHGGGGRDFDGAPNGNQSPEARDWHGQRDNARDFSDRGVQCPKDSGQCNIGSGNSRSAQFQLGSAIRCGNAAGQTIAKCAGFAGAATISCKAAVSSAPAHPAAKAIAWTVCVTHAFPAMNCVKEGANALDTCSGRSNSGGHGDRIGGNGSAGSRIGN